MTSDTAPTTPLAPAQAAPRLEEFTVIDVRTPCEYASGHLPGAHNVPMDRLDEAMPAIKAAAERGSLLVVCASGNRSANACQTLTAAGISAATLVGGTSAWAEEGHRLNRPEGGRAIWPMERQVRFTAGSIVLLGLAVGLRAPAARWLSAGVAAGLVYSAVSDTCGMAALLAKLPHNRSPQGIDDLDATLEALRG